MNRKEKKKALLLSGKLARAEQKRRAHNEKEQILRDRYRKMNVEEV